MKTKDTIFTHEELIKEIRRQIKEAGTQREYAALVGISLNTLSKVLRGKEPPGFQLLTHLGVETVVCYRRRFYDLNERKF
ncbi:MAG TPA: helix-turn-helix transcriptional regulator [Pyrinomonadaceae bacterium]|nr:helix-turn-helix transcriptional regulator [Pyrinomonadaceae bacterium]